MDSAIDHELFKKQIEEFDKHLELDGNYRIIFSGRFGIGKTTFLKHFFGIPENKKRYRTIHLFPVNYSVSENADIFEHIKYDIIAHLLSEASKNNITLDETTIPRRLAYPMLLSKRPIDVIAPLLHFLGPVGKIFEGYNKLLKELEEEREEMKNEKKALADYLEMAQEQLGSPYEQDFYSQLIVELLEQWKEIEEKKDNQEQEQEGEEIAIKETSKEEPTEEEVEKNQTNIETVLIVDDLDRVDPQHIFRLLNVFAAHFDAEPDNMDAESDHSHNKFGFDKVIFVCDESNIRSIFRHYYGIKADFNGYLDKFYSKDIYSFRIREDVLQKLPGWIDKFYSKVEPLSPKFTHQSTINIQTFSFNVLKAMILSDAINMRALAKLWTTPRYALRKKEIKYGDTVWMSYHSSTVFAATDILKWVIGNTDDFLLAIDKCIDYTHKSAADQIDTDSRIEKVLLVHLPHKRDSKSSENHDTRIYQNKEYNFSAKFTYKDHTVPVNNRQGYLTVLHADDIEYEGNETFNQSSLIFVLLKDLVYQVYKYQVYEYR